MLDHSLRRGDLVEIRGPGEIAATLDERGTTDGLPFMPEMIAFCGQRFVVDRRADKICDTINYTGSRRLPNAVLLADNRCDGSAHGDCQAECRLFWKEAWLRKIEPDEPERTVTPAERQILFERTAPHVKREAQIDGRSRERWVCQNTLLFDCSEPLKSWDPRPLVGQYTNGNVSMRHCVRVTARAAVEETLGKLGLMPSVFVRGTSVTPPRQEPLDLKPGDWVQIRSKEEIAATLTPDGYNRGLWFDREMAAYCGGRYRVRQRIARFIDEHQDNGKMIRMKSDAVTLEGVVCSGELSRQRWFCPRQIYPFWRECWLRRADA